MAKKILVSLLIVIGCALLFVVGSALVLFLAPGVELFGIRYVASGQGYYELPESEQVMDAFTGDIYIETTEIPVNVSYEAVSRVQVKYKQNFIGFTKSEKKTAYIEFEVKNNDLYIKTFELVKFLYQHQGNDIQYLNVYIPYIWQAKSINITSERSDIKFNANGMNMHDKVSLLTTGNVSIDGSLKATDLTIKTNKGLTLSEGTSVNNVKIQAGISDVKVNCNVPGVLDVNIGSGDLLVNTAGKLIFKSTSGRLLPLSGEKQVEVGAVEIETNSGNVNIKSITGTSKSTIKTNSGKVSIQTAKNVEIDNSRGVVSISQVDTVVVAGGIGSVTVNKALTSLNVTTRNGYIYLGQAEDGYVKNAKVRTTTGKIYANNLYGEIDLRSDSNSIDADFINASKITLHSGSYTNAYNLSGTVSIYSDGSINASVKNLSGNIDITSGSKAKTVSLDIKIKSLADFNYNFKSTKSRTVNLYAGEEVIENSKSEVVKTPYVNGSFEVKVTTSYANIYIYTA